MDSPRDDRAVGSVKRRRFRFTLRTLFIVVTALCLWLGWNVNQVSEREKLLANFPEPTDNALVGWDKAPQLQKDQVTQGFERYELSNPQHSSVMLAFPKKGAKLPITWKLLGAEPFPEVWLIRNGATPGEARRIAALLPELEVRYLPATQ